eukprot:Skav223778  [mRNA]  locus=scaffold521:275098:275328:+ [translate_table: standard]
MERGLILTSVELPRAPMAGVPSARRQDVDDGYVEQRDHRDTTSLATRLAQQWNLVDFSVYIGGLGWVGGWLSWAWG